VGVVEPVVEVVEVKMNRQTIIFVFLIGLMILTGCGVTGNVVDQQDYVSIPLADLSSKANFYEYDDSGVAIRYFAVLGSDGNPRTAFDACDVCGGYKGYSQQGDDMVCNNCGLHFSIDDLGTKNYGGGCWPSHLQHEVKGDSLIIKVTDLAEGRIRFQ